MNQYESMFILTPVLSDEQLREAVDRYRTLLKDNGCEVISLPDPKEVDRVLSIV